VPLDELHRSVLSACARQVHLGGGARAVTCGADRLGQSRAACQAPSGIIELARRMQRCVAARPAAATAQPQRIEVIGQRRVRRSCSVEEKQYEGRHRQDALQPASWPALSETHAAMIF
jgi:hypothetical protein